MGGLERRKENQKPEGGREVGTWKKGRWKEAVAREEPKAVLCGG